MPRFPYLPTLLWKFITHEDKHGTVWWRWEVYTGTGHLIASSDRDFLMLSECEQDAKLNGYVPPHQRR